MFKNLFKSYDLPVNATIHLLKRLGIKVTNNTVNQTILNHPDYPSILSISSALKQWHIENAAIRITEDKLQEMPLPFIAFINNNRGEFITVTEINSDAVTYANPAGGGKLLKRSFHDFIKEWSGVVLAAVANGSSGEKDYTANKKKEQLKALKIPGLILLGIGLILLATSPLAPLQGSGKIAYKVILFLKLAGIFITALLLWYEVDNANPALQKICTDLKNTNCNAILSSKQAKIFSWLSWSEVGFFYFAGGFLYLLVSGMSTIILLNLLALPYIFFSIYFQWHVAKQWCVLCLSVQALLLLEFITALSAGLINQLTFQPIKQSTLLLFLLAFTVPILFWYFLKPNLLKAEEGKKNKKELMRLKFNPQIFEALLAKQRQIEYNTTGLGITLGNPHARNTIIKVCNPYCGPCAKAHSEIERLLEGNNNIKVQIIFTVTNDEKDKRVLPVKHLLAVAAQNNEHLTKKALDDWYLADIKDYEAFATKYSMNGELNKQDAKVEAMHKWCKAANIQFTPTFFINGYQLPEVYAIGDLKYLLGE